MLHEGMLLQGMLHVVFVTNFMLTFKREKFRRRNKRQSVGHVVLGRAS